MSTIVGSYEIAVPARAEWTIGPVFRKGERVHVRASGSVAWGVADPGECPSVPGTCVRTMTGLPETFVLSGGGTVSAFFGGPNRPWTSVDPPPPGSTIVGATITIYHYAEGTSSATTYFEGRLVL